LEKFIETINSTQRITWKRIAAYAREKLAVIGEVSYETIT